MAHTLEEHLPEVRNDENICTQQWRSHTKIWGEQNV